MKTIEVTITVTQEGILEIHPPVNLPTNLEPGDYSGLIVVEDNPVTESKVVEEARELAEITDEELVAVREAIEASKEEDTRDYYITNDEIRQRVTRKFEEYKLKERKASA